MQNMKGKYFGNRKFENCEYEVQAIHNYLSDNMT